MPVVLLWGDDAQSLTLPIWKSAAVDFAANPSEHPVEYGTPIADHVEVLNAKGSFEVVISNTPIRDFDYGGKVQTVDLQVMRLKLSNRTFEIKVPTRVAQPGPLEVGGFVTPKKLDFNVDVVDTQQEVTTVQQQVLGWDSEFDACRDVLDTLRKLQVERTLVAIGFGYQTIQNAVLAKVSPVRNADSGGKALMISVSFEQLRFGTVERVATPVTSEKRGQGKTGKGSQAGTATTENANRSFAIAGRDKLYQLIQ